MIYLSRNGFQRKSNQIALLILFDWFDNRTHSKIDLQSRLITEPNQMIGFQFGLIDLWFDFVQLDMQGFKEG